MQFSVLAVLSLAALVAAGPSQSRNGNVRRQTGGVPVNAPAMTDANGNIVQFDATRVYQDSKNKGL